MEEMEGQEGSARWGSSDQGGGGLGGGFPRALRPSSCCCLTWCSFLEDSFPGSPQLSPSSQGPQLQSGPHSAFGFCLAVSLCPSLPFSDPPSFCFSSFCFSESLSRPGPLCVSLSLSAVPGKLPETAQDSLPTPATHAPPLLPPQPPRVVLPTGSITYPWGPRTPSSTMPSPRPAGPCPSSGHLSIEAKLSSQVAGHPAGEGAGPGCPRPSPQLRDPRIWHCPPGTAGTPCQICSAAAFPAPLSPTFPPALGSPFPRPWPTPPAPPTGPEPRGPPGLPGVNLERRGPALP